MSKKIKIMEVNKAKDVKTLDKGLRSYLRNVYTYMAAALFITAITSIITISNDSIANMIYILGPNKELIGVTNIGIALTFTPLIISLYFFVNFGNISIREAHILFWLYAALLGVSISYVGLIYTGHSIARSFFVSASLFGSMSLYGYLTKSDLTSIGSFMVMGLIGIILASIINIYLQSPTIYFVTSLLGIFVFMGLIAWDTQRIKTIYIQTREQKKPGQKMAILGALTLYLDIINLFLHLLRFLGESQNKRNN